jgi:hypothetical protein
VKISTHVPGTSYRITADSVKVRYTCSWSGLRAWIYQHWVCSHPNESQKVSVLETLQGKKSIQLCTSCGWIRFAPLKEYQPVEERIPREPMEDQWRRPDDS